MLFIPVYTLATVGSPWSGIAFIIAIATLPAVLFVLLIKWLQRQPRLRVALPWFVRSLMAISVISLVIRGGGIVIAQLIWMILPLSAIVGLLLGLIISPIVGIVRKSLRTAVRMTISMIKGSTLAAVLIFAIIGHYVGEPMFEEFANLEEAGDGMLGISFNVYILVIAIFPASIMGGIMGAVLGYSPERETQRLKRM